MKKWEFVTVLLGSLFVTSSIVSAQESKDSPKVGKTEQPKEKDLEEVVVTATRIETPSWEVASSITLITAEEIKQQQKITVLEVLRDVVGLDVVQTGGPGKLTPIFIRGAASEHTLVLIDGVEANDPISPARSFDFAYLTVDNIERIEVLRGPQSTLYGSDAIGGVVSIITKKGKGKPSFFISGEGGSFSTFTEKAGVNGGNEWMSYSFSISRIDTDGISAASGELGNTEEDGFENTEISARLGLVPTKSTGVDFFLRSINGEIDIDNAGGVGGDDPNNIQETEQLFFRAQVWLALLDGLWEPKLGFSLTDHHRTNDDDPDADHPDDLVRSFFDGQILKFDWQNNLYFHKTSIVILGLEIEEEKGKSEFRSESAFGPFESIFEEETARTIGFYLQDQIRLWDSFFATAGVRIDDHERFGTQVTYRIAPAYRFNQTGTFIKGTVGTGFKAPSLFQFFSDFGDQNLNPEESTGFDVGIEQDLQEKRLTLGATYFFNDFENLITFDSHTSKFQNITAAESMGIELSATIRPIGGLSVRAGYTYTDTENKTSGEDLLQRPKNKFRLDTNYQFLEKGNVNLGFIFVGERDDFDFNAFPVTRVRLHGYLLVNLAAYYDITKNFRVFGRVDNLFDEDYEEVLGFDTPGVSGFAGVEMSF